MIDDNPAITVIEVKYRFEFGLQILLLITNPKRKRETVISGKHPLLSS